MGEYQSRRPDASYYVIRALSHLKDQYVLICIYDDTWISLVLLQYYPYRYRYCDSLLRNFSQNYVMGSLFLRVPNRQCPIKGHPVNSRTGPFAQTVKHDFDLLIFFCASTSRFWVNYIWYTKCYIER